jgi:hypothetical protein
LPSYARQHIKLQIGHKIMYFNTANVSLLNLRYSIWRDFIYDFWVKMSKDFKEALTYIYYNPAVSVLFGVPFLSVIIIFSITAMIVGETGDYKAVHNFILVIVAALIVFILTSFRKTRFLGEPERYIEFTIPLIAVVSPVYLRGHSVVYFCIFLYSIGVIVFDVVIRGYSRKRERTYSVSEDIQSVRRVLQGVKPQTEIRLLSNNTDIVRYYLNEAWYLFYGSASNENVGKYKIDTVHPHMAHVINEDILGNIVEDYRINYIIIDTAYVESLEGCVKKLGRRLKELAITERLRLYQVGSTGAVL